MADDDLLEVFHAPQIAILADCTKIEARHAECLRANFRVPAIEAAEIEVGRAVPETASFDRVQVVNQEKENVPVRCIEGRRVLGNVDTRIVDPGRPVEHAWHLPPRITCAIAGDALHSLNQLMVKDPAIVWAGDGAKLNAAIVSLERFDLFGAIGGQAILQVDACERCGELPQVSSRSADLACKLAEAPMGRRDRRVRAGQPQSQAFGIGTAHIDMYERAFDHARPAAIRAIAHGAGQFAERQVALIRRAGKPLRGYPTDALAATHIHPVTAAGVAAGINNLQIYGNYLHYWDRTTLRRPPTR